VAQEGLEGGTAQVGRLEHEVVAHFHGLEVPGVSAAGLQLGGPRRAAPARPGPRGRWPGPRPGTRHALGHQGLDPGLEALGELGGVPQRPLLVGVRGLHEVRHGAGLLESGKQSSHPQAIDAVVPANQLLFAECNHTVHAAESTTVGLLPLQRSSR